MARKKNATTTTKTTFESIRHKDKRTNIPTEELRDFVADEEFAPNAILYPRDLGITVRSTPKSVTVRFPERGMGVVLTLGAS